MRKSERSRGYGIEEERYRRKSIGKRGEWGVVKIEGGRKRMKNNRW